MGASNFTATEKGKTAETAFKKAVKNARSEYGNRGYSGGRKLKRIQNWLHKHCGYGKYVIDCRYHPCIVTLLERYYHDIEGSSLINGSGTACSLMHCGIEPISKKLAEEMAVYAKTHTWNEYLIKYHKFTAEDIAEYERLDAI